jgi:hypothetical protein
MVAGSSTAFGGVLLWEQPIGASSRPRVLVLGCRCMHSQGSIFGRSSTRRALAVLGCVALLYLAAGGTFLHHHTNGPETTCHICQSLHMPALAAARLDLIPDTEHIAWHAALPRHVSQSDSFSLHRASRAPPTV